jgi:hypothetical protein
MRAAPVPAPDHSRSLGDPLYDPFWARVQESGVVVAFHGGDHGYNKYADDWGEGGDFRAFAGTPLRGLVSADRAPFDTFAALICHGVFDRFPRLRMASVEMGSDWVRELLRKLRKSFGQNPKSYSEDPVETFKRHVWVSPFHEEDLRGMADLIGVDRMLMGSDFPHAEGIPEPREYVNELVGFTSDEVRRVMRDNALELSARRKAERGPSRARQQAAQPRAASRRRAKSIGLELEVRVPGDFPEEAVRIGEVAGVATPEGVVRGLLELRARLHRNGEQPIDVGLRRHVVREREAAEPRAFRGDERVLRQRVTRVQRQPGSAQLQEGDVLVARVCGTAQPVAVEADRALQVGYAQSDDADSWFHAVSFSRRTELVLNESDSG